MNKSFEIKLSKENSIIKFVHDKFLFTGKTMRKAMADFAANKSVILPATVEDATVFKDIRRALQELGYAMNAPDPVVGMKRGK